MTIWPVRLLWCWRCFRHTVHTGRSVSFKIKAIDSDATGEIAVTCIVCRRCFNVKKIKAELDHLEVPAKEEEE